MSDTVPQNIPQKQCSKCNEWKDATDEFFYTTKANRSGLTGICRACVRAKWREQHPNSKPRKSDIPVPIGLKHCVACGKDLPATPQYFYAESRNQDGLRSPCRQCLKVYSESRQESIRESKRKTYQAHKEEIKRKTSIYAKSHRESGRVYSRLYYAKHYRKPPRIPVSIETRRERKRILYQENHRKNPGYYIALVNKRKARKRMASGTHTSQQLCEQYERQKGICYYCKIKIAWGDHHVEHVVPLARGGSNDISNIVISCPTCNLKKHDKLPHEWPEGGRLL